MNKRKFTLADVASEAGVSVMTVSRVVNNKGEISDETRRQVQSIIDRMNYRPNRVARSLVTQRTHIIGVVVPDITNPYFANIVRGVEDEAWKYGYNIILNNTVEQHQRETSALQLLEETEAEALVMCSPRLPDEELHPLLQRHRIVIVLNRDVPEHLAKTLHFENIGLMLQVAHLVSRGCQQIAIVHHGGYDMQNGQVFEQIRQQFGDVIALEHVHHRHPTWESGYEWMRQHASLCKHVDGIVCSNDLIALGVLEACNELGIAIPDDIALIGNDDILAARIAGLSTLSSPQYAIGKVAMQIVLNELDDLDVDVDHKFQFELVIRNST